MSLNTCFLKTKYLLTLCECLPIIPHFMLLGVNTGQDITADANRCQVREKFWRIDIHRKTTKQQNPTFCLCDKWVSWITEKQVVFVWKLVRLASCHATVSPFWLCFLVLLCNVQKNWSCLGVWHPECWHTNKNTRVMLSYFSASRLSLNEYTACCIYLLFKREKKQCNLVLVPDFCFHPASSIPAPCAFAWNVFRLCNHYKPSTEVFFILFFSF